MQLKKNNPSINTTDDFHTLQLQREKPHQALGLPPVTKTSLGWSWGGGLNYWLPPTPDSLISHPIQPLGRGTMNECDGDQIMGILNLSIPMAL